MEKLKIPVIREELDFDLQEKITVYIIMEACART
jgi:hypothetical protein